MYVKRKIDNPSRNQKLEGLVRKTHAASGFRTQVHPNAQEIRRTSGFATLAAYAVFSPGGRSNLSSLAAIPGNHFQNVGGAGADALSAANAGVVNLDDMRH
jgi:hypothetical protein